MKYGIMINLEYNKVMAMSGTRKLEAELDGQAFDQVCVPRFNSDKDRKTRKRGRFGEQKQQQRYRD